jgi:hypothetical protein
LQPHLHKPRRAVDTRYLLAGVHLRNSLMEHMIYTPSEIFAKGDAMTSSQICSHCNVIQSWLIGFTAEDESTQPHVQKCPVFNFTQGSVFHVILDI